jgi:hypothetical protein
MFEQVDMNIIHMRTKIRIIANQMLPVTALPYDPFTTRHPNLGTPLGNWQCLGNAILINRRVAKSASWGGISMMQWRWSGNTIQAMDDEGMMTLGHLHRLAQQVYMRGQQITTLPLQQVNGKEICTARMLDASIIRQAIVLKGDLHTA